MKRQTEPVLSIKDLCVSFTMYDRGMRRREFEMVHRLSLTVNSGEIVAVAGASGSGKSLLAHAVLGILPENANVTGTMEFCGRKLDEKMLRELRGREISFIPQSVKYLDPLMKVGRQVVGPCSRQERKQRQEKMKQVFARYQLEESVAKLYPHQLSGGMARRALISGAVMNQAKLIVADEPTPGLQEALAQETMKNFRELAKEGCGVLLITHDIDLALQTADRIAVFYGGEVLETAPAAAFAGDGAALVHPYSRALLKALPQNEFSKAY